MRYPSYHKQQTRQRIVRAAARRFRSRGTEGATIGNLMHDLRLTHGGFYRHFDGKEELFTDAFRGSLEELSQKMFSALGHATKGGELKALINRYLRIDHCEDVAGGCPVRLCNAGIGKDGFGGIRRGCSMSLRLRFMYVGGRRRYFARYLW